MKKSLLALAALTAFAGAASAQSSVTLFGIVDLAATSTKNGSAGSLKTLSPDQLNSNRLGFRGTEDLGGGMRAGFWIEGGMDPSTGGSGQNWQRRSTVSLMGGFGEVRLGRDYTPTFFNKTAFDPFGTNGQGSELNVESALGSGATTLVRANNTVSYFLPVLGGMYGQVQMAAGEATTGNKYVGARVGYAGGPVNVAVAYGKTYKTGTMIDDFTDFNVGGSFNLGFMNLMAQYGKVEYSNRNQTKLLGGVTVPFGASTLKASYIIAKGDQGSSSRDFDAKQFTFGYQYDLSKRTAIFANYSSLNNGGTSQTGSQFTIGNGVPITATYAAGNVATFGGFTSSGYQVGVRHSF
jgi:predicted porin